MEERINYFKLGLACRQSLFLVEESPRDVLGRYTLALSRGKSPGEVPKNASPIVVLTEQW